MDQWAWSVPNTLTLHVDDTFQVSFHLHKKCRNCFFTILYHMPTNQQPTLNQSDFFTPPVIFCLRGFKNLIIVLYINTIYYIHATGVMVIRISKSFSSSPLLNLKVTVSPVVNRKSMFWGLVLVWLNDAWKQKNFYMLNNMPGAKEHTVKIILFCGLQAPNFVDWQRTCLWTLEFMDFIFFKYY